MLELLVVLVLIFINGLFAMSELAVVSARRPRLKTLAERRVRGAKRRLELAADPGRFLSAVQIGITLIGILAGAFSGASLGDALPHWFQGFGISRGWPRRWALASSSRSSPISRLSSGNSCRSSSPCVMPNESPVSSPPPWRYVARVAAPFVWLLDASGRFVLLLLRRKQSGERK